MTRDDIRGLTPRPDLDTLVRKHPGV